MVMRVATKISGHIEFVIPVRHTGSNLSVQLAVWVWNSRENSTLDQIRIWECSGSLGSNHVSTVGPDVFTLRVCSKKKLEDCGILEAKWRQGFRKGMINLLNIAEMLCKKTEHLPFGDVEAVELH